MNARAPHASMSHPGGMPDRREPTIEVWHGGGADGGYTWGRIERQVMEWMERPELIMADSAGFFNAMAYCVGVYRARNAIMPDEKAEIILRTMRHAWEHVVVYGAPFAAGKDFVPDAALRMAAQMNTAGHMGMAGMAADGMRMMRMLNPIAAALLPSDHRPFAKLESPGHPLYDFVTSAIGPAEEIKAALAHPSTPMVITGTYDAVNRRHVVMNTKDMAAKGELNLSLLLGSMALPAVVPPIHGVYVDAAYSGVNGNHWRALLELQKREPRFVDMRVNEIDLGAADIVELGVSMVNPHYHADKAANDALLPLVLRTHPYRHTSLIDTGHRSSAKCKLFPDAKIIAELHAKGRDDHCHLPEYQPALGGPAPDAPPLPQRRGEWRTPAMRFVQAATFGGGAASAGA